jgi:hypothetical protein
VEPGGPGYREIMSHDEAPRNAGDGDDSEDSGRGPHRTDEPDDGGRADAAARQHAAPASARPDDLSAGVDPLPEVPGGPQIDVPALRGHVPDRDEDGSDRD